MAARYYGYEAATCVICCSSRMPAQRMRFRLDTVVEAMTTRSYSQASPRGLHLAFDELHFMFDYKVPYGNRGRTESAGRMMRDHEPAHSNCCLDRHVCGHFITASRG